MSIGLFEDWIGPDNAVREELCQDGGSGFSSSDFQTRGSPATKLKALTEGRDDSDEGKQCLSALSEACSGLQAALVDPPTL